MVNAGQGKVQRSYPRGTWCPIFFLPRALELDKSNSESKAFTSNAMSDPKAKPKDLKRKRAFIVPEAPVDPIQDSDFEACTAEHCNVPREHANGCPAAQRCTADKCYDPDGHDGKACPYYQKQARNEPFVPLPGAEPAAAESTIEDLVKAFEVNDLMDVERELKVLKSTIDHMKDNKVRPVWASLHKIWYTLGLIQNQLNNAANSNSNVDRTVGMVNRLYAWMKHVEKVKPELGLPQFQSFFNNSKFAKN